MSIAEIGVLLLALLAGGIMKGATGIGVPIIAVPVLAAYFDLQFAIAVILLPNFASNGWQVWRHRTQRPPRYLVYSTLVGSALGIACGVFLLVSLPQRWLSIALVAAILAFVLFRMAKPDWALSHRLGKILAFPTMILGGIMQGATGISAPVLMIFLSSLKMDRGGFIFSVSLAFLVSAVAHIPAMYAAGLFGPFQFWLSLLAIAPVLLGIPIGDRIAKHLSAMWFDRVIMLFLIVLAGKLAFSAFSV